MEKKKTFEWKSVVNRAKQLVTHNFLYKALAFLSSVVIWLMLGFI